MNKMRRQDLLKAVEMLETAMDIIDRCREDEDEAFDNLPESIQGSERGEAMESYVYAMEEAVDSIQEAIDTINDDVVYN